MIKKGFVFIISAVFIVSVWFSPNNLESEHNLNSNLKIYRDQQGIAHVVGYNKQDIFFGIGYAQAQDRLWTLFFKKMLTSGRITEIFGKQGLQVDKFMRNINLYGIGNVNSKLLDQITRKNLQKYADGVNYYVKTSKLLPFQFYLFWTQWEDWTIEDSTTSVALFHFILEFDWMYQLVRQRLKETVGYEFAMKLIPSNTNQLFQQITIIKDHQLQQMNRYKFYNSTDYRKVIDQHWKNLHINFSMSQFTGPNSNHKLGGSNAWVIGGNFTQTGRSILSNDPHLGLTNPSALYPIQFIILDKNNQVLNQAFGVMSDGLPGLSIGKNKKFAWGSTALYSDSKDLFVQTIKQQDNKKFYLLDGEWKQLKQRKEVFKIRHSGQLIQSFYQTHRGPLINAIFMDLYMKYGINVADHHKNMFSLQSTVYVPDDSTVKGIINLAFVEQSAKFLTASNDMKIINIDSVFITYQNQFGYSAVGRIPKKNTQQMGSFIKDGSTSLHDHLEYYSADQMPKLLNPKRGYIAMTNNKFASDHFDLRGSLHQISNGRASRLQFLITNVIQSGRKFNFEDMIKMQQDVKDSFVQKTINSILKIFKGNQKNWENKQFIVKVIQYFQKWNCQFRIDSIEASLYSIWENQFQLLLLNNRNLTQTERVHITNHAFFQIYYFKLLLRLSQNNQITQQDQLLCQNQFTLKHPKANPCITNMIIALNKLKSSIQQKFGTSNQKQWIWGNIHKKTYHATPWTDIPFLKKFWNHQIPSGGNSRTLNVGIHSYQKKNFNNYATAVFRFITDLNRTLYSTDLGVSDRIFSPYYGNFLKNHTMGLYVEYKQMNPLKEQTGWLLNKQFKS